LLHPKKCLLIYSHARRTKPFNVHCALSHSPKWRRRLKLRQQSSTLNS
jgi:hypothetical protein